MWRHFKIVLCWLVPPLLLTAFAGLWVCKFNQWDSLTFITVIPFWIWALPGILVSAIAAVLIRSRLSYIALAVWFLTAVLSSAETWGVFRSAVSQQSSQKTEQDGYRLKLVSINCRNGTLKAAQQAIALKPDILFLQEAPDESNITILTEKLFGARGAFVEANSTAIIGDGQFLTFAPDEETPSIHARFRHAEGFLLDLTNVKLEMAIPENEFWRQKAREKMKVTRIKNRKSVRRFVAGYTPNSGQPVRIVAGDFSTPHGDDIFRPMKKVGLGDAFLRSGRGTGNTFPQKSPVFRFDQVWISSEPQLLKTFTIKTEYSHHKILVCEFLLHADS